MIIPVALAAALRTCASAAAPDTMAAIVTVESAGSPYAINDNTTRRSYRPKSREEASRIAVTAIRARHSVDVGIAQVNSANFRAFHVDADAMLDPCTNLRVGSTILVNAYRAAAARFPNRAQALVHAIMAYNTGSIYAGAPYVRAVIAAATTINPIVPSITIVTSRNGGSAPILPPVQVVAISARPMQSRAQDPRQATLRVFTRKHHGESAGIIRNFSLQVDRGSQKR